MAAFRYQALKSSGAPLVRLLVVKPAASHDAPLECRLITSPFPSSRRYEAISYTWDGQSPCRPVLVDDSQLLVTPNVESALRHLRRRFFNRRIWVDSVCINQADWQDKMEQIGQMEKIYRGAARVVIWLGEGQNTTSRAMALLKWKLPIYKLGLHLPFMRYRAKYALAGLRSELQAALVHGASSLSRANTTPLSGLDSIIHHSWFRRLWTLQEISLARRAVLQCGHTKLSWRLLSNALTFEGVILQPRVPGSVLLEGGYNPSLPMRGVPFLKRMYQIQALQEWVRRSRRRINIIPIQRRPPLAFIINLILTGINPEFQVTEEVDRFYSLEGILQELGIQPLSPISGTPTNRLDLYFQAAFISLATRFDSLRFLLHTTGEPWAINQPSWIPSHANVPWSPDISESEPYDMESSETPTFVFRDQSRILELSGYFVDTVSSVSPIMTVGDGSQSSKLPSNNPGSRFRRQREGWIRFVRQAISNNPLSYGAEVALLFKLLVHPQVMGYYDRGNVPQQMWSFTDHRLVKHFARWLENAVEVNELLVGSEDSGFDLAEHFLSSERIVAALGHPDHSIGYHRALLLIQRWVREYTADKRLVGTEKGRVGIAWRSVQPGDKVVLVRGVGSPLLLRRVSHDEFTPSYRLMGPCNIPWLPWKSSTTEGLGALKQFFVV